MLSDIKLKLSKRASFLAILCVGCLGPGRDQYLIGPGESISLGAKIDTIPNVKVLYSPYFVIEHLTFLGQDGAVKMSVDQWSKQIDFINWYLRSRHLDSVQKLSDVLCKNFHSVYGNAPNRTYSSSRQMVQEEWDWQDSLRSYELLWYLDSSRGETGYVRNAKTRLRARESSD
jgi:hypothetical protein